MREKIYYTDMLGHYIVSDNEAEEFIDWLINEKKLDSYSLIDELEYQISSERAGVRLRQLCMNILPKISLCCVQCHKMTLLGNGRRIYRYETKKHTERISSSLVGGSNVYRKTEMTYATGSDFYCNDCLAKNRETKEEIPKQINIFDVIKDILLYVVAGAFISFLIAAILSVGSKIVGLCIGAAVFTLFLGYNLKNVIADYKKWKKWEKRNTFS